MLLMTAIHTEGPVSPAGVSPTLACEEEAGYIRVWPFSTATSHLLPREPLEAFLGAPQTGPCTDNNDKANGLYVRCETLQAGCRPKPPSDGMCRLPIPPKTYKNCQRSAGWQAWAPSLLGACEDRFSSPRACSRPAALLTGQGTPQIAVRST